MLSERNLHTDTLEEKYGPIHAIVLRHDTMEHVGERMRESKLVDENGILRTYAITFLKDIVENNELASIDTEIKDGALMGQTFRKHGYAVNRETLSDVVMPIPLWMQKEFAVDQSNAQAKLIEFYGQKETQPSVLYGTLIEIYSPDFKPILAEAVTNPEDIQDQNARNYYKKIIEYLTKAGA